MCNHQCSNCIGYRKLASTANIDADTTTAAASSSSPIKTTTPTATASHANEKKLLKIQLKKPLLKSIVLSANKNSGASAISSGFAFGKIKQEIDHTDHHYSDEQSSSTHLAQSLLSFTSDSITATDFMQTAEPTIKPQYIETMQFSNPKKTNKQINSFNFNKSNDFIRQQNNRSYSPPLPATHRLASMVSSESHHTAPANNNKYKNNGGNNNNNGRGRSHSSRDRKNRSSEKRKKHRRTQSRGSRSRSR